MFFLMRRKLKYFTQGNSVTRCAVSKDQSGCCVEDGLKGEWVSRKRKTKGETRVASGEIRASGCV